MDKYTVNSFFFNDTATTEIYTLSLHDALPISTRCRRPRIGAARTVPGPARRTTWRGTRPPACRWPHRRSEEHTSELQSQSNIVCRLLLEKKNKNMIQTRLKETKPSNTINSVIN